MGLSASKIEAIRENESPRTSRISAIQIVGVLVFACDRFNQAAHQPRQAPEPLSDQVEPRRIGKQAHALVFNGCFGVFARRKQTHPAGCHVFIAPCRCLDWIDPEHQMQMIAHDRICMDDNCVTFGHQMDACFHPVLAVFERTPGVMIDPAQKGAAHASLDAVIDSGKIGWRDVGTRSVHAAIVPWHDVAGYRGLR